MKYNGKEYQAQIDKNCSECVFCNTEHCKQVVLQTSCKSNGFLISWFPVKHEGNNGI